LEALRCYAYSDTVWNSALKPNGSAPDNDRDEEPTRTPTPRLEQTDLPIFNPDDAATTAAGFTYPVPYLPPSTDSVAPTTSTEAATTHYISTPKPDITVGLEGTGFTSQHQRRLADYQASGTILSDPHVADIGLRFPFLIAEIKGFSADGTLGIAQNQAAIGGASMLAILQDLSIQAQWNTSLPTDPESIAPQEPPMLCFSIVTAGPTHEVYVHYKYEDAFHMNCLRSFRTTHRRDARELVHYLNRIIEWGRGDYKSSIVGKISQCA
jgi:hypothetical protein